jgi:hypothetical protein
LGYCHDAERRMLMLLSLIRNNGASCILLEIYRKSQ